MISPRSANKITIIS